MPIEYFVDHERKLVLAKGRGTITDQDVFGYQREVWSRPDLAGYSEFIDMGEVERIVLPSTERVWDLALLSADMDPQDRASKFAIVAPEGLLFGLGRMYETYRSLQVRSTKQVGVFRSAEEAFAFLGIEADPRDGSCQGKGGPS